MRTKKRIQVCLPHEVHEWLKDRSEKDYRNVSAMIEMYVREKMNQENK